MESMCRIDKQKAIGELVEGHDFAIKLQTLLQTPIGENEKGLVDGFVAKVLESFTNTLSILKNSCESSSDVCQSTTQVSSPCSDDRKSENSGEKRKITKDRRGGYKRRRNAETTTKITPAPIVDGFSWRKYGQKEILNANFPRNYFRCTHRNDQGCQAIKQVQRTEEDPPTYKTIYMGNHTCQKTLTAPQLIPDSSPTSSYLLNFQPHTTSSNDHQILSPFPSIKQEYQDDPICNQTSTSEYLISADLSTFEASGSDHGDVISSMYSCITSSSHSLGNIDDFIRGSVNFDDVFTFDDEFLLS